MQISPIVNSGNVSEQPAESPVAGVAANIQHIESTGETLLSQQAPVNQPKMNTASPRNTNNHDPSQRETIINDTAKKWGLRDTYTVQTIANRLDVNLNELAHLSPENIFLHRSVSPYNSEGNCITQSQGEAQSRYFPNGGVPLLISLERKVSDPYAKPGHIPQMCKLSDVIQCGGKIINNPVANDSRAVVVILPPDVSIPTETLENYENSLQAQYEADIVKQANKWQTQDTESVKTIASALNQPGHFDIAPENIYLHLCMDHNQVILHNNTLTYNFDSQTEGIHFKVSLISTGESPSAITCKLSDVLQSGGQISHGRGIYDVTEVVVTLPPQSSLPY
ncbi:hypothetical protein PUG81_07255 [Erwiniaceae bacterium L1_54_6]|nr:hypothetical protein [Erwiniaceae bacterium L1_54_6]